MCLNRVWNTNPLHCVSATKLEELMNDEQTTKDTWIITAAQNFRNFGGETGEGTASTVKFGNAISVRQSAIFGQSLYKNAYVCNGWIFFGQQSMCIMHSKF